MNADGGIQLNDLVGMVRRRAKVAAFVALVGVLAAYWLAMALPNVFTSSATVLVEPQSVSPTVVHPGVGESDLNERLQLMTAQILSRARLSGIIDDYKLYKEESKTMLRQEIIDLMRSRIRVEPVIPDLQNRGAQMRGDAEINQFRIFFDDSDPYVARDVAQSLAKSFIDTHIEARVETTEKSLDFIQSELDRLAARIAEVEAEIAKVKGENTGSLPEEMASSQRRLERTLTELAAAQRQLAEATSDEGFYRSQLAAAAAAGTGGDANPMRRLEQLRLALTQYESRGYTEKHPDVRAARKEIAQLEANLEGGGEEEPSVSFFAQQTEAEARRAALRREAAEQEIERLRQSADEIQALINETPAVAEKLEGLNRERAHLEQSVQDFSKRRLEASVQAQLERRQLGEQFRVLEQAFAATQPSAPNRSLIVILGAFFSLGLGAAIGLLMEVVDTSAHDARQLQSRLQLPVLAAIPQIQLESDRARLRRRRIRAGLAMAGLVLFAIVGAEVNHRLVNKSPRAPEEAGQEGPAEGGAARRVGG